MQKFRNEKEKNSKEAEFLRGENETLRGERDRITKTLADANSLSEKYKSEAEFTKKSLREKTAAYKLKTHTFWLFWMQNLEF